MEINEIEREAIIVWFKITSCTNKILRVVATRSLILQAFMTENAELYLVHIKRKYYCVKVKKVNTIRQVIITEYWVEEEVFMYCIKL